MQQKHRYVQSSSRKLRYRARRLVVPHRNNQYRPYLVRSSALLVIFLVALVLPLFENLFQTGDILGRTADMSDHSLVEATNQERSEHQLSPLTQNEKLTRAAELKAKDMFSQQYWSHTSDSGTEPWHWFREVEYSYAVAGENLAKNFATAEAVMTAWMNSPEHRKNLLDGRYRDVGFAVEQGKLDDKHTTIVVALYGTEKVTLADAAAQTASQPAVLAAQHGVFLSPATRMGVGLHSLTLSALISLLVLLLVVSFSLLAHAYRKQLPLPIRRSWRKHHGAYKALAAISFGCLLVLLFGVGQI